MKAAATTALAVLIALSIILINGCGPDTQEQVSLTFIEFFDPRCPFCAEMEPTVERLREDYTERLTDFRIVDVTTDEGRAEVGEYGVFITPTFVLLDGDGEELDRIAGAASEETMISFIERGISDVLGEESGPIEDYGQGEGSAIE